MEALVTRDYGGEGKSLTLSKSNLGNFVYHLLKLGGYITNTHTLAPEYNRSYVQMSIMLPEGKREELTKLTGITLELPSTIGFA